MNDGVDLWMNVTIDANKRLESQWLHVNDTIKQYTGLPRQAVLSDPCTTSLFLRFFSFFGFLVSSFPSGSSSVSLMITSSHLLSQNFLLLSTYEVK